MKLFSNCLILCGLIFLVACSGGSSKPPVVSPPPGGDVWLITALEASDANPVLTGSPVVLVATVTLNGAPAPDESSVEFAANGGILSNGKLLATVLTTGGKADIGFGASAAGYYAVTAKVKTVTRNYQLIYEDPVDPPPEPPPGTNDDLQIFTMNPDSGSYSGGATMVATGKGIVGPVEVTFTVQGFSYPAIVEQVVQSNPVSEIGSITLRTPEPTAADTTITFGADVNFAVQVGTSNREEQTLPAAFTYIGTPEPPPNEPPTPPTPAIFGVDPYSGSSSGGETVTIRGMGFNWTNPLGTVEPTFENVYFLFQGQELQTPVVSYTENQIVVVTPRFSTIPLTTDTQAGIKLTRVDYDDVERNDIFLVKSDEAPTPVIYAVDPNMGRSEGGESVTIFGLDFMWDDGNGPASTFDQVFFVFRGQDLFAQVERVSPNQIEVITPRFSLSPLQNDEPAGLKLTRSGFSPVEKASVFVVKGDVAEPVITGISPTAGPMDGGTLVTITGSGFEIPTQVLFGTWEATDCQVVDDQSPADFDIITCRTPDISQQGLTPPYAVTIRVTNLQTGKSVTSEQTFTFGEVLYVGQANPTEGQIGDLLTLYGAGFEDPLTVWFSGNIEFDVISVTGTELTLRSPTSLAPTCGDRSGNFRVVLNESNREASGGNYTLLGSNPTVTSVDPIFVEETNFGNGVVPGEIDIYGVRFAEDLLVRINNFTIAPNDTEVISSEHIHISQIPAPNDFGLIFNTGSCTTNAGLTGIRNEPTPVNVTVRNLPLGCESTLPQGLVYVPEDQECVAAPAIELIMNTNFPPTAAGTCSAPEPLTIANNGSGTLEVQTVLLQGRFFFDGGGSNQNAGPFTVPPLSANTTLQVYFCPDNPNGLNYPGVLVVTSNDAGSPEPLTLSGTEATPPEITTDPANGQAWPFADVAAGNCGPSQIMTITNSGISDLTLQSVNSSDGTQFQIVNQPSPDFIMTPGQVYNLEVQFCPTAVAAGITADLTINHNASNQASPITVPMIGNGI